MSLTLQEWDTLPEDDEGRRLECVRGVVVVVPAPQGRHQAAGARLWALLDRALPAELRVLPEVDVLLESSPLTVRMPDVVVLDATVDLSQHRYPPAQVHLVVEILSPSSGSTDRVTKLREYAAAGIAEYWIVDLDVPTITCFRLGDGAYDQVGEHIGTAEIETCGTRVTVDIDGLGV